MSRTLARFAPEREADFLRLHSETNGAGWCRCVAWWVPTWDGWGQRSEAENADLRRELCARGEHDGFLLYQGSEPIAWCQAGPRDRLCKLREQFALAPDPETWALSCFFVAPAHRGGGVCRELLERVLEALRQHGVRRVEVFPKRGAELEVLDLWTGPEALFRAAGFEVVRDDPARPVLALELRAP